MDSCLLCVSYSHLTLRLFLLLCLKCPALKAGVGYEIGRKIHLQAKFNVQKNLKNSFSFIKIQRMKMPLKNVVWKEGEFYVAQCLNVEVSSFGDSKEEALKNLQEALDLYFEDMPVEDALTIEHVEIISTEMEHA
jgi:predicted RNase H-like HicB family nuclease